MAKNITSGRKIAKKLTRISKKAGEATLGHVEENIIDRISHIKHVRLLMLEWALLVIAIIFLSITQAYWYTDSYAVETYQNGGTYTEATVGEIKTLNPLFASSSSEKTIAKLLFLGLSENDYSGHSGYGLAKSIKTPDNGKTWLVKLREGLKWSDGEPLTNEDVIFTANLIKNPLLNSNYSSNLSGVRVETQEDGAISFNLAAKNVYFATALDFPILPKHILDGVAPELILEHNFSSKPVGSGAFVYNHTQSVGNLGEKVVYLQANDKYYKNRPKIDSFIVHSFLNTSDVIDALNAGTVTASGELNGRDVEKVNSSSLSKRQSSLNYGVFAFINTETVSNKSFRKALKQGIDLSHVREVLSGEQPLDYPILDSQLKIENYPEKVKLDTNTAKKTIKKVLDGDSKLKESGLNIATVRSGYLPEVSERLAEEIKSLGVNANVTVYEPGQDFLLNTLAQRNYDILVYEIGLGPDPDVFAYYHSTEANANGHNLSNYKNTIVSDLVLSARSTMGVNLRTKKYESFLKYFNEDVPAIGLYQSNLTYFANKNVRAFSQENRFVTATDRLLDVEQWGIEKTTKNRTP